jgi:hypothetical protein
MGAAVAVGNARGPTAEGVKSEDQQNRETTVTV